MNTKEITDILPINIKNNLNIDELKKVQELRIKVNKPLIILYGDKEVVTSYIASSEDIKTILQRISNYSIYAFQEDIKQGFITIKGGHRVGICGNCVVEDNNIKTIKSVSSLNIRICREVEGCSQKLFQFVVDEKKFLNSIIISPPKCGKTTILRDIVKNLSDVLGDKVCVIDERSEIGACYNGVPQMNIGLRTDILDSCPKSNGIMLAIRSMSPDVIACDEIGTRNDVESILMALNCGVKILTTIHGEGIEDLYDRVVFSELIENKVFKRAIVLSGRHGAGTIESVYDFDKKMEIWRG